MTKLTNETAQVETRGGRVVFVYFLHRGEECEMTFASILEAMAWCKTRNLRTVA